MWSMNSMVYSGDRTAVWNGNGVALRTRIATEAGITSGDVKVSIGGLRAN